MKKLITANRILWALLIIGLLLRVIYTLGVQTDAIYSGTGGDRGWYLANGIGLWSGQEHGYVFGVTFYASRIPTAPLYLIFVGFCQLFAVGEPALIIIRLVQALSGTATIYFAYRLSKSITQDERAALMTAAVIALNPAFIIEPSSKPILSPR